MHVSVPQADRKENYSTDCKATPQTTYQTKQSGGLVKVDWPRDAIYREGSKRLGISNLLE